MGINILILAVLGLRADENLFVSPSPGKWEARYVPAFVRRYPFVLADLQQGKQGVCLDMAFSGLNDAGGEALFAPDGRETPFLQNAIQFLNQFQAETVRTAAFCQRLAQAGVLVEMNARTDLADGSTVLLNGLQVVDEQKLLKLPDATLLEFFRAGEMSWIYAHLVSLGNLNALAEKLVALKDYLATFDRKLALGQVITPGLFNRMLKDVTDEAEKALVKDLITRMTVPKE